MSVGWVSICVESMLYVWEGGLWFRFVLVFIFLFLVIEGVRDVIRRVLG